MVVEFRSSGAAVGMMGFLPKVRRGGRKVVRVRSSKNRSGADLCMRSRAGASAGLQYSIS